MQGRRRRRHRPSASRLAAPPFRPPRPLALTLASQTPMTSSQFCSVGRQEAAGASAFRPRRAQHPGVTRASASQRTRTMRMISQRGQRTQTLARRRGGLVKRQVVAGELRPVRNEGSLGRWGVVKRWNADQTHAWWRNNCPTAATPALSGTAPAGCVDTSMPFRRPPAQCPEPAKKAQFSRLCRFMRSGRGEQQWKKAGRVEQQRRGIAGAGIKRWTTSPPASCAQAPPMLQHVTACRCSQRGAAEQWGTHTGNGCREVAAATPRHARRGAQRIRRRRRRHMSACRPSPLCAITGRVCAHLLRLADDSGSQPSASQGASFHGWRLAGQAGGAAAVPAGLAGSGSRAGRAAGLQRRPAR